MIAVVLVIGCGGYQPIDNWIAASSSKHSVYADPSNRLHAILKFKSTLSEGDGKDPRDYMSDQGGAVARWLGGMKAALSSVQQLPYIGPKSQNGGEVIISAGKSCDRLTCDIVLMDHADGDCEYISRMQNTVDHINVSELAILLGVSGKGISEG
jgi:hypothetical protein